MRATLVAVLVALLAAVACSTSGGSAPGASPDGAAQEDGSSTPDSSTADSKGDDGSMPTSDASDAAAYPHWACVPPYSTPATRDAALWPFAPDSPWNTPLGAGAQFEQSTDACTKDIGGSPNGKGINSHEWSHPVYLASASDPTVNLYENSKLVDGNVHCPANAQPALPLPPTTDAHLHIVEPAHHFLDEMWEASKVSDGWNSQAWAKTDLYGPGVGQGGVRAYGGSAIGGLIRAGELKAEIRHVLAFAIDQSQQKDSWVWPATTNDQAAAGNYTGHLPMGQLVGIPPGLDLCTLGLSTAGLVFARALQDYGAYLVDSSGGLAFYAEPRVEDDAALGEASLLNDARTDLAKIVPQLRCVTDSTMATPGGGGPRRAPPAPNVP
jgi:hypothetical protein